MGTCSSEETTPCETRRHLPRQEQPPPPPAVIFADELSISFPSTPGSTAPPTPCASSNNLLPNDDPTIADDVVEDEEHIVADDLEEEDEETDCISLMSDTSDLSMCTTDGENEAENRTELPVISEKLLLPQRSLPSDFFINVQPQGGDHQQQREEQRESGATAPVNLPPPASADDLPHMQSSCDMDGAPRRAGMGSTSGGSCDSAESSSCCLYAMAEEVVSEVGSERESLSGSWSSRSSDDTPLE